MRKPLKVALCDDNVKERAFFHNMCKLIKERKHIQIKLKEYDSGSALLFDMEDSRILATVDIVLLDINLPGQDGIDVAHKLRELGFQGAIIFITKSEEHWKDAFDVKAFNYITKDKDVEKRFVKVFMEAVKEALNRRGKTLLFSAIGETRKIDVASISHFEVADHLIRVYYGNEKFEFVSSLSKIETLLFDNDDFMRVNRGYLLSVPHVERIVDKNAIMLNGQVIPVAPKYMKALKAAMTR